MERSQGVSRREFFRTLGAAGVLTTAELLWWEESLLLPRAAHAAAPVRFLMSLREPLYAHLARALVERFNGSQSDVEVRLEFLPRGQTILEFLAGAATRPDCCQTWDSWLSGLDRSFPPEDLGPRLAGARPRTPTLPVARDTVTVKGRMLGLPWALANDAILVRVDRLKASGGKVPDAAWTWDDFLAAAKRLTRPDQQQYGFGLRGAGAWALLHATEFMYGNGATLWKDGALSIDSPEAAAALEWYIRLFRTHAVAPPTAPFDGYSEVVDAFGRGVTGMYVHGPASVEDQKRRLGESLLASLPLPLGPAQKRASFCSSQALVLFADAGNKEGAWRFLAWLMDDEPHYHYCRALGLLPSRQALLDRPHYRHPAYAAFIQSLPFTIANPYLAFPRLDGRLAQDGVPLLRQAMLAGISAKECLSRLAELLAASLG
jgi:multiple sugar transport system substrate-binding protein